MKRTCGRRAAVRLERFFGNLSCGFASATSHIEAFYRGDTISGSEERSEGLVQSDAEGANDAGTDDGYPLTCHVWNVKYHRPNLPLRNSYCFPNRSTLLMSPKPENESLEVERLSVE